MHARAPQNVAGQKIVILDEEEECLECLAPTWKMFCVVEARAPAGSHLVPYNQPKSLGEVTGELAVAGWSDPY